MEVTNCDEKKADVVVCSDGAVRKCWMQDICNCRAKTITWKQLSQWYYYCYIVSGDSYHC